MSSLHKTTSFYLGLGAAVLCVAGPWVRMSTAEPGPTVLVGIFRANCVWWLVLLHFVQASIILLLASIRVRLSRAALVGSGSLFLIIALLEISFNQYLNPVNDFHPSWISRGVIIGLLTLIAGLLKTYPRAHSSILEQTDRAPKTTTGPLLTLPSRPLKAMLLSGFVLIAAMYVLVYKLPGRRAGAELIYTKYRIHEFWPLTGVELRRTLEELASLGREASAPMDRFLNDHRPSVRADAVSALARRGPHARFAIPSLMRLLDDEDAEVRQRALVAVQKITRENFGILAEVYDKSIAGDNCLIVIERTIEPALYEGGIIYGVVNEESGLNSAKTWWKDIGSRRRW